MDLNDCSDLVNMNCYEEFDPDKLDILTRCSHPHTEVPVYHCENICPAHFGALCKTNYALIILSIIFLIRKLNRKLTFSLIFSMF